MTKQTPVRIVCPKCGSENVHKDAAAAWNAEAQAWELSSVHDSETCNDCGAEGDFFADRRPLTSSGDIGLGNGLSFRWMLQGGSKPEIYAWLERDHSIVTGTGGFWRTTDPDEALDRCKAAFPAELEAAQ